MKHPIEIDIRQTLDVPDDLWENDIDDGIRRWHLISQDISQPPESLVVVVHYEVSFLFTIRILHYLKQLMIWTILASSLHFLEQVFNLIDSNLLEDSRWFAF